MAEHEDAPDCGGMDSPPLYIRQEPLLIGGIEDRRLFEEILKSFADYLREGEHLCADANTTYDLGHAGVSSQLNSENHPTETFSGTASAIDTTARKNCWTTILFSRANARK